MKRLSFRHKLVVLVGVASLGLLFLVTQLPVLAAGGLLHPMRRRVDGAVPENCQDATFISEGITLKGWRCHAVIPKRGTVVYLHGVADNRTSATGVIQRFVKRGFDVVTYDSRAHGESGGDICTYGYF